MNTNSHNYELELEDFTKEKELEASIGSQKVTPKTEQAGETVDTVVPVVETTDQPNENVAVEESNRQTQS